jgi:hypothetical protein
MFSKNQTVVPQRNAVESNPTEPSDIALEILSYLFKCSQHTIDVEKLALFTSLSQQYAMLLLYTHDLTWRKSSVWCTDQPDDECIYTWHGEYVGLVDVDRTNEVAAGRQHSVEGTQGLSQASQ